MGKASRRRAIAVALLCGAASPQAMAQSDALETEVAALIEAGIAEWTLLATCTATDPSDNDAILRSWSREVDEGAAAMRALGLDALAADLEARSDIGAFMREAPFAEVVAYCRTVDWRRWLVRNEVTHFEEALEAIAARLAE